MPVGVIIMPAVQRGTADKNTVLAVKSASQTASIFNRLPLPFVLKDAELAR